MSESAQKEVVEPVPAAVPMLSTHTISQLEHAAAVLLVDEPEVLLHEWLNLSAVLLAQAKQIRQRVEQLAVEWIDQRDRSAPDPSKRALAEWRSVLTSLSSRQVEALLLEESERADRLRQSLPFVDVLTPEDRAAVFREVE